jgi:hypothetical protein
MLIVGKRKASKSVVAANASSSSREGRERRKPWQEQRDLISRYLDRRRHRQKESRGENDVVFSLLYKCPRRV